MTAKTGPVGSDSLYCFEFAMDKHLGTMKVDRRRFLTSAVAGTAVASPTLDFDLV
jgi:hypothetical protein